MKRLPFFIAFSILAAACTKPSGPNDTWRITGGSKENIRYSTLTQIDTSNVSKLAVAWTYHTGDADTVNNSQIQCNPIIVDGIMYATSPKLKVIAVDGLTGQQKWVFDPTGGIDVGNQRTRFIMNNNRGVTYWESGEDKRILFTASSNLYALDAKTGQLVLSFGDSGVVDLHDGLGRDVNDLFITSTSPGIIYKNLLILGTRVSEGSDAAPGHIRAYDVKTGKQAWIFHTIPHPGEIGYETWEDTAAYKHIGGANSWSGFSLDEKRGMLFAPVGSASFDFYGGMRKGDNLFANSTLALDAATGKYIWHYQNIHHDIWDRDLPTAPALVTVMHDGKKVDAVAQPTKTGFIFLLDRETGKPLWPVQETPVPNVSELEGEKLSPTQPIPTLPRPFMRQTFTESDLNDLLPDSSYQDILTRYRASKVGLFEPLSPAGTIFYPGLDGGAEWGGPAFDPETGLIYINANEIPWLIGSRIVSNEPPKEELMTAAGMRLYNQHCAACHGPDRKGTGNFPTLIDIHKKYSQGQIGELISSGRRMMPALAIKENEREAISTYVMGMKSNKKFVPEAKPFDPYRNLKYSITGYNKFQSKEKYPAIKPPWGTLNAVDLNTGEIAWRIPFGTVAEFKAKGIETGSENYGGPAVTASGVLFIAATPDGKFRAYNKKTGKLLFETDLPAPGFATVAVYEAGGRQFVVVPCGGGKLGTKSGDAYVAFALPVD
ncbi:MAG TPA: PQQ-binding-like beta-propeller repeat protein [Cyclobacteriaceae bacterium]|nr:PQQ-binding-like beta-propeller repeat protein [Cyclobacteriaceae bacterium]